MLENRNESGWLSLPNPFPKISKQTMPISIVGGNVDTSEAITGHVSCRRTDIAKIIMDEQSAIFLVGTQSIGKSTLIRYLQRTPEKEWTWREELRHLNDRLQLNNIHFVQIDLTPLEGIEDSNALLSLFIKQCIKALSQIHQHGQQSSTSGFDLKELRLLLRTISRETPDARYFVMLDSVERLGMPGMRAFPPDSRARTSQERALTLLERCNAIHTLVDLVDEFTVFGVILSVESLPRPKIDDQFHHVSADLARFTSMILQAFTWDDTTQFLAQKPEDFGVRWANMFKILGGSCIFSRWEQEWLRQEAGTHPYLLQHFCYHTFRFKQEYANIHKVWPELQESDKTELIEMIKESLSPFLAHIWQRLQEAIKESSPETKGKFNEFIHLIEHKRAEDEIDPIFWYELGPELRYILYSEGIVRYDRLRPIHFPGSILCQYLIQEAKENKESSEQIVSLSLTTGRNLTINRPGDQLIVVSLSELEYRLLKTLTQHPERCTEHELMKGAWGMLIERSRFTQRMHQLRKKLKEQGVGTEIIENSYGGFYSLNHPEWLYLN
jgi:DNA-binding winged helix-turn-helix (wHTH) protein